MSGDGRAGFFLSPGEAPLDGNGPLISSCPLTVRNLVKIRSSARPGVYRIAHQSSLAFFVALLCSTPELAYARSGFLELLFHVKIDLTFLDQSTV